MPVFNFDLADGRPPVTFSLSLTDGKRFMAFMAEAHAALHGAPATTGEDSAAVYISGPMTGLPGLNFQAFNAAADSLRARGRQVVNPAEINPDSTMSWQQCMRADIKALCGCATVALLPGWERSQGAHLELHIGHRLGLDVTTVGELLARDPS